MDLTLPLMRICGTLAVLAALCFASSAAQAHAGHAHHAKPAVASATQTAAVSTTPAAERADVAAAKRSNLQGELKSADTVPAKSSGSVACGNGCCTGAPCLTCFGLPAVSEVSAIAAPRHGSRLELPDASPSKGLGPDGIRRPPRSFV